MRSMMSTIIISSLMLSRLMHQSSGSCRPQKLMATKPTPAPWKLHTFEPHCGVVVSSIDCTIRCHHIVRVPAIGVHEVALLVNSAAYLVVHNLLNDLPSTPLTVLNGPDWLRYHRPSRNVLEGPHARFGI